MRRLLLPLLPSLGGCSDYAVGTRDTVESFVQVSAPAVDLLLVVDGAGAASPHAGALPELLGALPGQLSRAGVDWRIGVVGTAPEAGWRGPLVDLDAPQPTRLLEAAVRAARAAPGGGAGLAAAVSTLEAEPADTAGEVLRRVDTPLSVLFVADTDDTSGEDAETWGRALVDQGDPGVDRAVELGALVVRDAGACAAAGFVVGAGDRYRAAVAAADGLTRELCAPELAGRIADLGDQAARLGRALHLASTPVPESLVVELEGEPLPCAGTWTLQARGTGAARHAAVVFRPGAEPPPHAVLRVAYDVGAGLPTAPWCD